MLSNTTYLISLKKILVLILVSISIHQTYSQSINDYRSVGSGNWTDPGVWEIFNGTIWVPATNYPGELVGTNDVSVESGFSITLSSAIPNSFNSLTVGVGEVLVSSDSSLDTFLITLITGGTMEWTSNNTDLALPANASVIINGGDLSEDNPCNATKTLTIGTTVYASCNGGGNGVDVDFGDLNTNGGTLNVSPSSNSPVCVGESLNLFANPSGVGSNEPTTTFSWSATGPGGYTFSSSAQDPVINTSTLIAGTYTYTVTITDPNSNTNADSIDVIIGSSPNAPVSNGNQLICAGNTIPALSATPEVGATIDWYDANSGGILLLTNSLSYTPSTQGNFYAEARNTTTNCVSLTRTVITLTISSCKVITNRRITYRVRGN